ncbi:hypothetical protein J2127_000065 [Methanococcus voltae]|uniref:hypothetical protein n=1 Tax=Methanococcus voltae TaxID=2188 RepID=UPI001AEA9875|nr:hypothetical protein [Methanococcus voltae]MBP2142924.1 hypothetical protein [Methanococcus voltae]
MKIIRFEDTTKGNIVRYLNLEYFSEVEVDVDICRLALREPSGTFVWLRTTITNLEKVMAFMEDEKTLLDLGTIEECGKEYFYFTVRKSEEHSRSM